MKIFRLFLWFCCGFLLSAVPLLAFSATIYTVPVAGVTYNAAGQMLFQGPGQTAPRLIYPQLQTTSPLSVPISTTVPPGRQLMVIPTSISANVPRVAGAVVGLARLSGPIGLGLTLLPILCEETGICQSSDPNQFAVNKYSSSPVPGIYRVMTSTDHPDAFSACYGERFSWCAAAGDCDQIAVYNQTSTTFACSGRNMNQNEFKETLIYSTVSS